MDRNDYWRLAEQQQNTLSQLNQLGAAGFFGGGLAGAQNNMALQQYQDPQLNPAQSPPEPNKVLLLLGDEE